MILTTLLAATLSIPGAAPFQEPDPAPPEEIERLKEWPELSKDARRQLKTDIQRLRKARTPAMAEEAEGALRASGAGIVPELLPVLGKERDKEALGRVELVLLAVTGPEHTRLLAAYFEADDVEVRTFALRRVGVFPDEGVRAPAEAALARLRKRGEKADETELYAAALCVTSAGSLEGFDLVADAAARSWTRRGGELRAALEAVRGPAAAALAAERLGGEREDVLCGLNLLSGCGDLDSAGRVKRFLDSDDHQVRVAAINALRAIVDGEEPLEKLPVFEAIELAKRWKSRV